MALATCRGGVPSVRTVNATYLQGCFYIITYASVPEDGRHPGEPCCGPLWGMVHLPRHGGELGWFGREENRALAARLRQSFASWIENGHNDFSDTNTIILRVRVTDAVLLSHGRRFEKTAAE